MKAIRLNTQPTREDTWTPPWTPITLRPVADRREDKPRGVELTEHVGYLELLLTRARHVALHKRPGDVQEAVAFQIPQQVHMSPDQGEGALRATHECNVSWPRPMMFADNAQAMRSRLPG